MRTLQTNHPALSSGRTIFLKQVKASADVRRILQPASMNGKLGKGSSVVLKGKWKGMHMYSLSLEERKTCPKTCQQWSNCYGNNMPFANRIAHEDPEFLELLEKELQDLLVLRPSGIVIRLHVLGDFYSTKYVNFWKRMLKKNAKLKIFGYTHRTSKSSIGKSIQTLNQLGAWIRWSDAGGPMSANVIRTPALKATPNRAGSTGGGTATGRGIVCPEQTGKTESCLTCGLCWSVKKPILFIGH